MDDSTRPSIKRRQKSPLNKRFLAAILFVHATVYPLPAAHALTAEELSNTATSTASIADDTAHEVAISMVKPGDERMSLTARLTTMSVNIAKDVKWQIRSEAGELLVDTTASEIDNALPPGQYTVEAQYGAVALRETVTLQPENAIAVSFVLNAGGLRVLPALKGIPLIDLQGKTLVFALGGPMRGKLIAHSEIPGEVIKLPAGQYRVESRFGDGNTVAVTDVRIRPGKMSAVEVTHQAGLARLSFVGAPDANVSWQVKPLSGPAIASFKGLTRNIALTPGNYLAEAHVNGEVLTAQFRINAGEERDIMLGN